MSTSSVTEITNTYQLPIGINKLKPIANSQLVDMELELFKDLIDPNYHKWFAKRCIYLNRETVTRIASEARNDGRDHKRLFAYLIAKATPKGI